MRGTALKGKAKCLSLLGVLCFAAGLGSSCEPILDKEPDCRLGVALKFVYDYHMEPGGDAFAANVDCVNVFVFDKDGNYVKQSSETSEALRDGSYRMDLLLDAGDYHIVVYGGTACENATFNLTTPDWDTPYSRSGEKADIRASLPLENGESSALLHDPEHHTGGLFYGTANVSVSEHDWATSLREVKVNLMKDTNNIQIILQELSSPYKIEADEYNFYIIDDNFVLDGLNNPVSTAYEGYAPVYRPYHQETAEMGYVEYRDQNGALLSEDEDSTVQVARAEFSTSRLFVDHIDKSRLVITSATEKDENGEDKVIINIPLIMYLTAVRGFGDSWIKDDQEFLDRQSRWTMMFFLQKNVWVNARVSVNWWTVRINNAKF